MAYDGKVMRLALQRFEEDRQRRQAQYQERRERIFARQPRLREIDGELRSTMSRIITSALRHGTDPRSAVAVLRDENLSLQAEKRELLQKMGLPEDALEETPACALCGDTGYRNGRVCRCLRGYYAREQQKELSRMLDLGHQSFDTFSTDWYPDRYDPNIGITVRQHMEMIYDICADFAHQFGKRPANLLLFGAPGLGKTHLSAAIALATQLRENGIRTQLHCEEKKFKQKISYADKLGIPYVIFLGEDEIAGGVVACKDMATGEQTKLEPAATVYRIKAGLAEREKGTVIQE